jgi:hypothetical protein
VLLGVLSFGGDWEIWTIWKNCYPAQTAIKSILEESVDYRYKQKELESNELYSCLFRPFQEPTRMGR